MISFCWVNEMGVWDFGSVFGCENWIVEEMFRKLLVFL